MSLKWFEEKVFGVVALSFLFFIGLMLVDYGTTAKNLEGIVEFQTLFFNSLSPGTVYHMGMGLLFGSFFILVILFVNEFVQRHLKRETDHVSQS